MIDTLYLHGAELLKGFWPLVWSLLKIIAVVAPLMLCVAYLTLWERKAIGWSQIRPGPNRVGPYGLLTPIADAVKLIFKEIIKPAAASKGLFFLGPVMTIMPALAAWAVVPFGPDAAVANVNAGLLFLMAITSLEVYGVIIAGWASNSKYAFLGALRASAQMVSYEIAMGFALVVVLMVAGSVNMTGVVQVRERGWFTSHGVPMLSWNWLLLFPIFIVYFISGLAETNRHPFDVVEGESEIVAGHMIEYSGMSFDVLPCRIRQHDPRVVPGRHHVPGRLERTDLLEPAGHGDPRLHPAHDGVLELGLAVRQDLLRRHDVPVGACHVPPLPLRPDHASGLEDLHSHHADLAGRCRCLDADPVQHLEVRRRP